MELALILPIAILLSSPGHAATTEQYSRQQTRFVNQMKETSTGLALPGQDFKRFSATASFSDGSNSYIMTVFRVQYGDMVYFLILSKESTIEHEESGETEKKTSQRLFRMAEDRSTIEEATVESSSTSIRLAGGYIKTMYKGGRYAEGAYSNSLTKPWSRDGSLTDTDFLEMNENVGADTTITSAHQTTFSLPITLENFRAYLPGRVRGFFDRFRGIYLSVATPEERDQAWQSLTLEDVLEMKPKPGAQRAVADRPHTPQSDPPPSYSRAVGEWFGRTFGR